MARKAKTHKLSAVLTSVARDLLAWFEAEEISQVIIGGVAVSVVAKPRSTKDIDAVILYDTSHVEELIRSAARHGFIPRYDDAAEFARDRRMVLLKHQATGVEVDISCGVMPFDEEVISRAIEATVRGVNIKVATPEDLIVMKAIARRSKDIIDIETIIDINPDLDFERIRRWVGEFAAVLEMPEIMEDLEKLLLRPKLVPSKRRKR